MPVLPRAKPPTDPDFSLKDFFQKDTKIDKKTVEHTKTENFFVEIENSNNKGFSFFPKYRTAPSWAMRNSTLPSGLLCNIKANVWLVCHGVLGRASEKPFVQIGITACSVLCFEGKCCALPTCTEGVGGPTHER